MRLYSIQLTGDESEIIVESLRLFCETYPDSADVPHAEFVADFLVDQLEAPNAVRGPDDANAAHE